MSDTGGRNISRDANGDVHVGKGLGLGPSTSTTEGVLRFYGDCIEAFTNGSWGCVGAIEDRTIIPRPEGPALGQSNRAASLTYEGGSFFIFRTAFMNKIIFSVGIYAVGGNAKMAIYQTPTGKSPTASDPALLIGGCTVAIGAATPYVGTFDEGVIKIRPGIFFILWGKDGGTFQLKTRTQSTLSLFDSIVDADTHPVTFTTTLNCTVAPPASLNPLAAGGIATATTADTYLSVRLKNI